MRAAIRNNLTRDQILPALFASIVNGILLLVLAISFATLIFSGGLLPFLPQGIGLALFTTMITTFVIALTSSFPSILSTAQDGPIAAIVVATMHISEHLQDSPPETMFVTVLVLIAITSFLTGLLFIFLGHFHLGNLIRFIPYPVIGGFLAGTGVVFFQGGMRIMTDGVFELLAPGDIFTSDLLVKWAPGLTFAVLLLILNHRFRHFALTPAALVFGLIIFWASAGILGESADTLQARSWLLGPFPEGQGWKPIFLHDLTVVQWSEIIDSTFHIAAAIMIGLVAMLLKSTGLEASTGQEIDLDHELQMAGAANVASALGGGLIGFNAMGASVLAYMMGAKTRLVGIFMAMLFAAVLLFGTTLIVFVPKLLLGGLLIYLGFSMMERWLYGGLSAMGREDYAIVVLIVVVVAVFGYLQGIAIGMLAAIVTFVFHYSRINVIKHTFSGAGYQSKVDRPVFHRRHLISTGDQLTIYVLEGALFFGTANNLLNQIKQRVDDTERRQPKFLILNFHMVKRLDSSVVMAFNKLRLLAQHGGFVLVFTGLNQQTERIFQRNRFSLEDTDTFRNISEPDEAVEWCEDQTLKEERITREILPQSLKGQLEMMFPNLVDYEGMVQYLKKQHFEAGDYLARQGDPSDSIYFIEQGSVSVQLEVEGGTTTRLRKLGAGTLIGEIALYSHRSRSASVIAETTATVYSLSNEDLQRMETEQPNVAAAFHKFIAHLLAERLADNTTSLSV